MEELLALCLEWTFFLLGVLSYILIRCIILIVRVCIFYRCKALWISFVLFLACIGVSGLVLVVGTNSIAAAGIPILISVGFIQLTITAKIVEITYSDVFMKEPDTLIDSVLHTNWFQLQ